MAASTTPPLSHRIRAFIVKVHRWIGLILGAWLVLVALTGSLMAWRGELTGIELGNRFPLDPHAPGARIPRSVGHVGTLT